MVAVVVAARVWVERATAVRDSDATDPYAQLEHRAESCDPCSEHAYGYIAAFAAHRPYPSDDATAGIDGDGAYVDACNFHHPLRRRNPDSTGSRSHLAADSATAYDVA